MKWAIHPHDVHDDQQKMNRWALTVATHFVPHTHVLRGQFKLLESEYTIACGRANGSVPIREEGEDRSSMLIPISNRSQPTQCEAPPCPRGSAPSVRRFPSSWVKRGWQKEKLSIDASPSNRRFEEKDASKTMGAGEGILIDDPCEGRRAVVDLSKCLLTTDLETDN